MASHVPALCLGCWGHRACPHQQDQGCPGGGRLPQVLALMEPEGVEIPSQLWTRGLREEVDGTWPGRQMRGRAGSTRSARSALWVEGRGPQGMSCPRWGRSATVSPRAPRGRRLYPKGQSSECSAWRSHRALFHGTSHAFGPRRLLCAEGRLRGVEAGEGLGGPNSRERAEGGDHCVPCDRVRDPVGMGRRDRPFVVTFELRLAGPGRQGTGHLVTTCLPPSLSCRGCTSPGV